MKIAVLSTVAWRTPPRHYGAYEWVASTLAEGLVKKGHDVTLFATGDSETSAHLESVSPKGYEEDKTLDGRVWETMHIANVFEQAHKFDIIHNLIDIIPISYSKLVKTPVVTTFHGIPTKKNLPLYERYNDANYFVAPSYAARKPDSLKYFDVIYHGIDLDQYPFGKQKKDYLFCMARIHPEKGIHHAIEIAQKANKKLIIAGLKQDEGYFNEKIEPHLAEGKIEYVGSVGGKEKLELLSGAYAFLHPIECDEAFGLGVVEAQACGTPVIVFNRGSMPEVVKDGETGFVVDNVAAAIDALKSIEKIDSKNCRKWIKENFSQEKMVDSYIALYERILPLAMGFESL